MGGWCPSSSVCGMAVVCAAAVLPSAMVWLVSYSSHCSASEYCCHVVHCSWLGVWRVGGGCMSVVFVWWGILCPLPPRRGCGWGHCGWWGAVVVVGGMTGEGRLCCWPPRLACRVPRLLCGGPVEWREWWGVCCPRARIGSSPFTLFSPPSLVLSNHPSLFVFAVTALLV